MCSRINGRCLFKKETLASHGCHSVERQQRHGTEIGFNPSRPWNQRLAQAPANAWEARFYFSKAAPRHICGWLLLARLPVALPDASRQSAILARKDFTKRSARPRNNPPFAPDWRRVLRIWEHELKNESKVKTRVLKLRSRDF
jgi:hypothetical protein